jgi:outer membrane protein
MGMAPTPARAQEPLSLDAAIAAALRQNPELAAARAGATEAEARIDQARAAYLPRVDVSETWQRGNQPVFVFGSLLAQRQFGPQNFQIDALNRPDAVSNLRTAVTAEQLVYDGGRLQSGVKGAFAGARIAALTRDETAQGLRVAVTQAYGQVLAGGAHREAAAAAVLSATEDLASVEHRRNAGLATDADVLAARLQLARMQERVIVASSQEAIARAQLNAAMGEPLDRMFTLQIPAATSESVPPLPILETDALTHRPDVERTHAQRALSLAQLSSARSAFLPHVGIQGGWEANGDRFDNGASSWSVGLTARWNVFAGMGDAARLRESKAAVLRSEAERAAAESRVRVDVRIAAARVDEARAREIVSRSAEAQALERQRIVRDRFDAGLATASDVLQASSTVFEARLQHTTALVDVLVSHAMLDRARGR